MYYTYYLILTIILILLVWYLYYNLRYYTTENFDSSTLVDIYTTFEMNNNSSIDLTVNNIIEIDSVDYIVNNYKSILNDSQNSNDYFYYICDPLDYDKTIQYLDNTVRISSKIINIPNGYFIIIRKNVSPYTSFDCGNIIINNNDSGTKIGYFDRPDKYFIQAMINGYRQDNANYQLIKMSTTNFNIDDVDYIITYVVPNSSFHKWIMDQSVSIYGFKNIDIDRIKLFYPFISSNSLSLSTILLPNNLYNIKATVKDSVVLLPTTQMIVVKFNKTKVNEQFVNAYIPDSESLNPDYDCRGINGYLYKDSKARCNSDYGFYDKKTDAEKTVWDKKCKYNYECPFFQANENYPNKRGGCLPDGKCEFPIGVKRIGPTKYDDTGKNAPFCYGCSDNDINCCKNQTKPDYAFANDTNHRIKHNLAIYNMNNI